MKHTAIKYVATSLMGMLAAAFFSSVQAHVVLEYQVAQAGRSYKATFKVGHGCGASATRQIVVDIPVGARSAHPMPKPGWTLVTEGGAEVSRVSWTAKTPADALPSSQYDEFVVVAQMPAQAGPIYWPVRQVCDEGRSDWTEVPAAGQNFSDLKSPAALLEILPAEGGGHVH